MVDSVANELRLRASKKSSPNQKSPTGKSDSSTTKFIRTNVDIFKEFFNQPSDLQWWLCFSIVTLIAFCTRLYKISEPNHVW